MAGIFISYRQADTKAWAIGLRDDLAKVFGEDQVFLDKDALGPGNWRDQLQRALERCSAVLVVIGRQWLTSVDDQQRPRLSLPDDVHRQEIALALHHRGVIVIPVLVDDAAMPKADQLPEDIRSLADQQAYKIGDTKARRQADLEVLVKGIETVAGLVSREAVTEKNETDTSENPSSWYKPDLQAVLLSCVCTSLVAIATYSSGGMGIGEISGWLIVFYGLIIIGKLLLRRLSYRRRGVI